MLEKIKEVLYSMGTTTVVFPRTLLIAFLVFAFTGAVTHFFLGMDIFIIASKIIETLLLCIIMWNASHRDEGS